MTARVAYRRIYEEATPQDGKRVLVDRLWPRGMSKERAELDEWLRDVAPSADLRRWYHHDPQRYDEFRRRYYAELEDSDHETALRRLRDLAAHDKVTLLTATKDVDHSEAAALAQWLDGA
ncbi:MULTISPECIES: DUF488 domain-containing protein [Streptomyces]|uniref:DUF488 domain-containing protein n=1 Tax=Streptomyces TaxID=1883 RepID=UPI0004BD9AD3|nr:MULTISPECIES: DUF488 family protein [Streptomyces]KOU11656.1 MarR family transcriptional regulator [Streptomyces sp. NRRL F-4711]KOX27258.1 MarR family transcriptional regulator [Streptomyces sp. NRRL F-4707]MCL7366642.1 DUF488 family protein [Streptomyces ardesiacus]